MELRCPVPKPDKTRVALLVDDARTPARVTQELGTAGLDIRSLPTGRDAIAWLDQHTADLLLLEQTLPDMTGIALCRRLRSNPRYVRLPIVFYSRKGDVQDRIAGLEAGADDYVPKSRNPRELILRLRRLLRRDPVVTRQEVFRLGRLEVDLLNHAVRVSDRPCPVTLTEFRILTTLADRHGRVISREELLNEVWPGRDNIDLRSVDSHIRRLRSKLGSGRRHLQTVRAFGYRLTE